MTSRWWRPMRSRGGGRLRLGVGCLVHHDVREEASRNRRVLLHDIDVNNCDGLPFPN